MRKLGYMVAALGALVIAAPTLASAETVVIKRSGGYHHHHHGFRFGFGIAAPPVYYGGDCYWRRTVHINRWGERVVRRVRVCD